MQAYFPEDDNKDEATYVVIPVVPNESMQAVIKCSTGAKAQQFLNHILTTVYNGIVCLNFGMCTVIKNG